MKQRDSARVRECCTEEHRRVPHSPARRSPELVALIEFVGRVMPAMYVGDVDAAIDQMWPFLQKLAKGAESDPSPSPRERCAMLLFACPRWK